MWGPIIAALIAALGPVIADFLKQLLDKWLNKAAATLPVAAVFGNEKEQRAVLFDRAIEMQPWWAKGRKALLRRAKALSLKDGPPSEDEASELMALGMDADTE